MLCGGLTTGAGAQRATEAVTGPDQVEVVKRG